MIWPFRALVGLSEQPADAPAPEKSAVPLRY
jgi:hypothetical protein